MEARMKRWHEDVAVMARRAKVWDRVGWGDRELGRFRKRHPLDCGRPRCGLCHGEKNYAAGKRSRHRREALAFEATAEGS
jgi:hypothetical protein